MLVACKVGTWAYQPTWCSSFREFPVVCMSECCPMLVILCITPSHVLLLWHLTQQFKDVWYDHDPCAWTHWWRVLMHVCWVYFQSQWRLPQLTCTFFHIRYTLWEHSGTWLSSAPHSGNSLYDHSHYNKKYTPIALMTLEKPFSFYSVLHPYYLELIKKCAWVHSFMG